jgi:hypothetical protein
LNNWLKPHWYLELLLVDKTTYNSGNGHLIDLQFLQKLRLPHSEMFDQEFILSAMAATDLHRRVLDTRGSGWQSCSGSRRQPPGIIMPAGNRLAIEAILAWVMIEELVFWILVRFTVMLRWGLE